jgi:NitT/TauT family transport system substrate-binding protein
MFSFTRSTLLGALMIGLAAAPAAALEKVTMSHASATLLRLPFYVAVQNGYFEDENIDLEVVDTRSGSDAMKMLAGGSVDFSTGQLLDAVLLNKRDIPVRGIAMLTRRMANSMIVRKDLADEVKSMADLKGRKVGVTGVGSGTWQFAVFLGSLEGIAPEEFNFISVGGGNNVIGAVKSGRVDAMSYADPQNAMLVKWGDAKFLYDMTDAKTHEKLIGDSYLNNQMMVLKGYAEENPEIVQGFVNAIQRAVNWVNQHSIEETAKVIYGYPAFAKSDYDQLLLSVQRVLPDGVSNSAAISRDAFENAMKLPLAINAIEEPMSYDQLVLPEFAENAEKKYPGQSGQ